MYRQVVLIGDSLTQYGYDVGNSGWCAQLQNTYIGRIDFLNRGVSGYTTEYALYMIKHMELNWNNIVLFIILLGSNDSIEPNAPIQNHVEANKYYENLFEIIGFLRNKNIFQNNILLITPPVVDEEINLKFNNAKYNENSTQVTHTNSTIDKYRKQVLAVAANTGTLVLDLFGRMMELPNWKEYLIDGLHLNSKGNQFLYEEVNKIISPLLKPIQKIYPSWREFYDSRNNNNNNNNDD